MMEKIKKNMKPTLVLGIICIIVAALLAAVNLLTEPVIKDAEIAAIQASLETVIPNGDFEEDKAKLENAPETVTGVYKDKNGGGYVVTLITTKGYTGQEIGITVGIGNDGKIIKAVVTKTAESKITDEMRAYPDKFAGLDASEVGNMALVSGVTYSSDAVKAAIADAMNCLGFKVEQKPPLSPTPLGESELEEKIAAILPEAELEAVTVEEAPSTLYKTYRDKNSGSYIFYIITSTQYVPKETEALVVTDKGGTITKIEMLQWNVGYDDEIYDAPPQYTPEYINSMVGKGATELSGADLVTGVTRTSSNLRYAISDSLNAVFAKDTANTVIAIVLISALAVCGIAALIYFKRRNRAK